MKSLKLTLIAIFAISSIACSKSDKNESHINVLFSKDNYKGETDWERDGLKGKIKEIIVGDEVFEYNENGFRTKATNQQLWCVLGYEEMGSFIYKYDSSGRIIQKICYNSTRNGGAARPLDDYRNGEIEGWRFASDYRGEEYVYSEGDTMIVNYNYNQKGDSLFFVVNEGKDTIWHPKNQWYITRYEEIYYPSVGGLKFDNKGRVSILFGIPHTAYMDMHYYYTDKDQLIKDCWVNSKNGNTEYISLYKYDNNGNVTKKITEDSGDTWTFDYKYIYDKRGNWIERTESFSSKNDNSRQTTKRIIEYYQ